MRRCHNDLRCTRFPPGPIRRQESQAAPGKKLLQTRQAAASSPSHQGSRGDISCHRDRDTTPRALGNCWVGGGVVLSKTEEMGVLSTLDRGSSRASLNEDAQPSAI